MEDLRDGSRNRLWSGNVTPPPSPPSPYASLTPRIFPPRVPFRFTRGRGSGRNDPIIARKHDPFHLSLLPPFPFPFSQFSPNVLFRVVSRKIDFYYYYYFSRNICFSRYRTGKKRDFFSISATGIITGYLSDNCIDVIIFYL